MHPNKPWYTLYALLLITLSAIGSTAIANSNVRVIFEEATVVIQNVVSTADLVFGTSEPKSTASFIIPNKFKKETNADQAMAASMFSTIIQGADRADGCSTQGFCSTV